MPVKLTIKKGPDLSAAFNDLMTRDVVVGIPASSPRKQADGSEGSITNADIGYIMEFGAPEANIPARPFLIPGIASVKDRIVETLKRAVPLAIAGDRRAVQQAFDKVGLIAQSAVQNKITDGPFQPLSPVTLRARKSRGFSGERPLIGSGEMWRSVVYIVREKGPHDD